MCDLIAGKGGGVEQSGGRARPNHGGSIEGASLHSTFSDSHLPVSFIVKNGRRRSDSLAHKQVRTYQILAVTIFFLSSHLFLLPLLLTVILFKIEKSSVLHVYVIYVTKSSSSRLENVLVGVC